MTLFILLSLILGIALIGVGIVRRAGGSTPQWQSGALIVSGLLLQSWWLVLLVMVFIKFVILKEDT